MTDWNYFSDDIKELRHRAKISGIALFCSVIFFLVFPANPTDNLFGFYKPVISLLLDQIRNYLLPSNFNLLSGSPSAPITIYTIASVFFGFLVASPVIFYEAYAFIRPAFKSFPNRIIWSSIGMFLVGCGFGFFIMTKAVMIGLFAFFPYAGVNSYLINAQDFYSTVFWTVLVTGLSFLTPVVIYLLARYGTLDPKIFTKNRKYLWGIVYIISAVVTPDSNILADFVLFIPLILMIEASFFFAKRVKSKAIQDYPAQSA